MAAEDRNETDHIGSAAGNGWSDHPDRGVSVEEAQMQLAGIMPYARVNEIIRPEFARSRFDETHLMSELQAQQPTAWLAGGQP